MSDLISIQDLDAESLDELVATGERIANGACDLSRALRGKVVGLYFSQPSTRTRTSFFTAVQRMGGTSIVYSASDLQTTTGESLEDTGMVLGLYLDALVMRTNRSCAEMRLIAASAGGIPVINALSKAEHPTQAVADLITIRQEFGTVFGKRVLYLGAWNNTVASLVLALTKTPATDVTVVTPAAFAADRAQAAAAFENAAASGSRLRFLADPSSLPREVDVVYTVRWQSMGETPPDPHWRAHFEGFQVDEALWHRVAHSRTIFMHDLPAHRALEVAGAIIDGPCSRIRRQARNKMVSAMCVMESCVRPGITRFKERTMTSPNTEIEQEASRSHSKNTYLSVLEPEFRKECDKFLADLVADTLAHNADVAGGMNRFTRELFIRSTIEIVLRIEMMRKINPLASVRASDIDPVLCKQWTLYAADEGLHSRLFAKDLHVLGVTDEEIFGTRRLFATELLGGYCYQTLAEEGPLGVVSSAYYVETISRWTQPAWLDGMEKVVGPEAIRGARGHVGIDDHDHHVDLAWNMCMRLIKTADDRVRFKRHLVRLHGLLVAYVIEVTRVVEQRDVRTADALVPLDAIKAATAASAFA